MQGIDRFRATQREPKKETQRRKDARTQREEKRKEKREKIGMEMSKEEHSRHPRCGHLATRLKLHPEPTNDSSRTPHPLSHTLFPALPYPTLPYPTLLHLPFASLRLCVFAFNSFCLPAWPGRMSFANGSHSGKGSSPRPRSVSGARPRAIDRPALGSDRLRLPFVGSDSLRARARRVLEASQVAMFAPSSAETCFFGGKRRSHWSSNNGLHPSR